MYMINWLGYHHEEPETSEQSRRT